MVYRPWQCPGASPSHPRATPRVYGNGKPAVGATAAGRAVPSRDRTLHLARALSCREAGDRIVATQARV